MDGGRKWGQHVIPGEKKKFNLWRREQVERKKGQRGKQKGQKHRKMEWAREREEGRLKGRGGRENGEKREERGREHLFPVWSPAGGGTNDKRRRGGGGGSAGQPENLSHSNTHMQTSSGKQPILLPPLCVCVYINCAARLRVMFLLLLSLFQQHYISHLCQV